MAGFMDTLQFLRGLRIGRWWPELGVHTRRLDLASQL